MSVKMMLMAVVILSLSSGYGIAQESQEHTPAETEVTFCPVCGPEEEMHGLALGYKYKGQKYTFCSMECLKAFKENPEAFLEE